MILAVDTETTGLDLYHEARPYFITTCDDSGTVRCWEWDVDPLTREVAVDANDVVEIEELLRSADTVVGQNIKFDVGMLGAVGVFGGAQYWPWDKTEDTISAGHVLASNEPHDLTHMVLEWVGVDIQPYEDRLQEAVVACRGRVQQARLAKKRGTPLDQQIKNARKHGRPRPEAEHLLASWRIAEKGLSGMPSAGKEPWKADAWLVREMAKHDGVSPGPELADYANTDSESTLLLWFEQLREMQRRGFVPLYRERIRGLKHLLSMERRGVTVNRAELRRLKGSCAAEVDRISRELIGIALSMGHVLELPKSGMSNSLAAFLFGEYMALCALCGREQEIDKQRWLRNKDQKCFCNFCKEEGKVGAIEFSGSPGLDLEPIHNPKAKTNRPSFDSKIAIPYYLDTLDDGPALRFIKAYEKKGGRSKAVEYLTSYESFGVGLPGYEGWIVLHPIFNGTGTSLLRRSSSNPNGQNIGKKKETNLRRCFGPSPGREWWSLDYKNLELRIPAWESGEADLMNLFLRPDDPPFYGSEHLLNFSVVYPDIWEGELGKVCHEKCCNGRAVDLKLLGPHIKKVFEDTYYQWVKNGDFAVGYGAIDRDDGQGTADRTFRRAGSQARLESRFAKKSAHNQRCIEYARRHGYVETMVDQNLDWGDVEPKGYPLLVTRSDCGDVLPTTPLNFRTQGTAGWLTLKAINRIGPLLEQWTQADPRGWYVVLEVHDELVFDFPAGSGSEPWRTNIGRVREVQKLMEQSGDDVGVPTPTDVEYHASNWGEGLVIKTGMELKEMERTAQTKPKLLKRRMPDAKVGQETKRPGPRLIRRAGADLGAR